MTDEESVILSTGIHKLDAVLDGGLVRGHVVSLVGPPGMYKTTMMLQAAQSIGDAGCSALFLSAEHLRENIEAFVKRVFVRRVFDDGPLPSFRLWAGSGTDVTGALAEIRTTRPEALFIDSASSFDGRLIEIVEFALSLDAAIMIAFPARRNLMNTGYPSGTSVVIDRPKGAPLEMLRLTRTTRARLIVDARGGLC